MKWPGPGSAADVLIFQHVLGLDMSKVWFHGGVKIVPPGVLDENRIIVPPVTTKYSVAVNHLIETLEDEGWFFSVGNLRGPYEAVVRCAGNEYRATSRRYAAEAISLAAMKARGIEIEEER